MLTVRLGRQGQPGRQVPTVRPGRQVPPGPPGQRGRQGRRVLTVRPGRQDQPGPQALPEPPDPQGRRVPMVQPGPAGPAASQIIASAGVTRAGVAYNQGDTFSDTASCPVGKVLLGGGAVLTSTSTYVQGLNRVAVIASYPSDSTSWTATVVISQNFAAASNATITAYAVCTS